MRLVFKTALLATLLAVSFLPAKAAWHINHDPGGRIGTYIQHYQQISQTGGMVVIDGDCLSACTLVLGLVAPQRICVTKNARLGFHKAWRMDDLGRPVYSPEGTAVLWELYPAAVRHWLVQKQGGLKQRMVYLQGRVLARMYRLCELSPVEASAETSIPVHIVISPSPWSHAKR